MRRSPISWDYLPSMGALLERVSDEATLLAAWNSIRSKPAADRSTAVRGFERRIATSISRLSAELSDGSWTPRRPATHWIDKRDGGRRRLSVPPVSDRVVHRAMFDVLDPVVDPILLPWVFGFRRGLGIRDAIAELVDRRDAGDQFVVRADIADCFDEIPHVPLLERLEQFVVDTELCSLIARILRVASPSGIGVSQGSPLAPLLANVHLSHLDEVMLDQGIPTIRYADDLAVTVRSAQDAERALAALTTVLDRLGLRLSEHKTKVIDFADGVSYLGTTVTALSRRQADRLDHPSNGTVYVTTPRSVIRRRGSRLRIVTPDSDHSIGFDRIRQVVIFGGAGLTTPALTSMLEHGIELTLLSDQGRYFGRIQGASTGDPHLRAAQYRRGDDADRRLDTAKRIVSGKITNQRNLLLRRQRNGGLDLTESSRRLDHLRRRCSETGSINALLGVEGAASREYFHAFGRLVAPEFVFDVRRRRPPPDPVNSMLSFGYTLLVQEVASAIELAGLDPSEGSLHGRRAGRPSLALDLAEEFRSVIVDSMVLAAIKRRQLVPNHFTYTDDSDGRCTLTGEGRAVFIGAYEQRMLTKILHQPTRRHVSYRVALGLQALGYASELRENGSEWRPMVWK